MMSHYANFRTYELRYSDFDFKDEIKPSALLELVQQSACESADELGFGYYDLKPKNFGFIVVNTYCKFLRPIVLGDLITVETWPLPPRHVIFERGYRVTDREGSAVALLTSRWCLVDLGSFSLLTPDRLGETHDRCPYRAERSVDVPSWKIPRAEGGREVRRMRVGSSQCDHYFHANNARYADFFLDCFTMEELAAREVTAFQIAYEKQAKEGGELIFFRRDEEDNTVCEARVGEDLIARFRIWFKEKTI